jgi:hypothetical protein
MRKLVWASLLAIGVLLVTAASAAALNPDTLVTVGSPQSPFSQNKQNEPAITNAANHPNILVAGSNDNIDLEACNSGADNTCPFTPGVGVSGVYFSFNRGQSWTQPTYTGWSARNCLGVPGPDPGCNPMAEGPIGTLPWYYEKGLASDGDPGVAIGPRPGPGGFSWSNGDRLYYSNLTANFPTSKKNQAFKGFEAIAVSRTDHLRAAAASHKSAWKRPVLISRQSGTTFSDKSQIWADNASSSPFFGTVYVCWAAFKGQEKGNAAPAPLQVAVSHDGGTTWTQHQISAAANNSQRNPEDGCTIRTDSRGNAYVFGEGTVSSAGKQVFEMMSKSTNGGHNWSRFRPVAGPVTQPGAFDPVQGRPVIDGVAGARSDLAIAPSVDIANGAPTGADATDRIVMSYVSGTLAHPHVYFTESTNRGTTWSTPRAIESAGDRGLFAAPAISPNGTNVYVVYNAFTTPFRHTTARRRSLVGVVMHASSSTNPAAPTGAFTELHRSRPGDPRGSSANALESEFLGDYVYATATRTYGAAVWNDTRRARDCRAIDRYRQALQNGNNSATPPDVQEQCPAKFGNQDIFGGSYAP